MFNFLMSRTKVVVDAFTYHSTAYNMAPISKGSNHFPDWWKDLPARRTPAALEQYDIKLSTLKRCNGLIDLYKNSLIIPLWSDLALANTETDENLLFTFADSISEIQRHERWQYEPALNNYKHGKIIVPWMLKERTGINFTFIGSLWNLINITDRLHIPPGIANYRYQHAVNVNFFVEGSTPFKVLIPAGTGLVHLIPNTDKEVVVKNHQIDHSEYQKIYEKTGLMYKFSGNYTAMKKAQMQCPFK